jgi:predicted DNA-binding transcriptional regulator AlpA
MWLHKRLRDAGFPPPVTFGGRCRYWRVADVLAWERAMIAKGAGDYPKQLSKRRRAA